ncbi:MAG TPA: Lrp/AsnC family transcriptional regulator [Pedobacter sp.]|uniref:Lrp/AsnC family transcriptional regulator n=1 Tax=Pedobacter sp. TaxID=1411316 RepID=UPI002C9BBFD0|nr:Lrp/AsnC family transcriptional regulator [Pedobacter sp.]HMI01323.1 Lrp/AsnC family transcriptional regulator [Pedobacter sp.]
MEQIDEIDKIILKNLQQNAKITTKELASILNLSISPVYERIKRLESHNYIKRYVAILNKILLKQPITTMCQVSMRYHNEAFIEKFEQEIKKLDEVQECYHIAGQVDFLLKINIGSLDEYHDFVKYKLSKIDNIGTLNSTFVLKEIKHTHAFNLFKILVLIPCLGLIQQDYISLSIG